MDFTQLPDISPNTSGQGPLAQVPAEIDRWNWGAFLLNWIWGIGNNTFLALLVFVPFVGFVMPFVLGAKGSSWAWRNKRWDSVAHFRRTQRKWALWGLAAWVGFVALFAAIIFGVMSMMKNSEVYKHAVRQVQTSQAAMEVLGPPVSTGYPTGSVSINGPKGEATLSFSVQGSKAKGTVYLDATLAMGKWRMNQLELEVDGRPERIDLNE